MRRLILRLLFLCRIILGTVAVQQQQQPGYCYCCDCRYCGGFWASLSGPESTDVHPAGGDIAAVLLNLPGPCAGRLGRSDTPSPSFGVDVAKRLCRADTHPRPDGRNIPGHSSLATPSCSPAPPPASQDRSRLLILPPPNFGHTDFGGT